MNLLLLIYFVLPSLYEFRTPLLIILIWKEYCKEWEEYSFPCFENYEELRESCQTAFVLDNVKYVVWTYILWENVLFLSCTCIHTFLVHSNVNVRVMTVCLWLFFIRSSSSMTAAVERVKRKRARPFSTLYYRKRVEQSTVAVRMRKTLFSTL
jgi:hypothetical protein